MKLSVFWPQSATLTSRCTRLGQLARSVRICHVEKFWSFEQLTERHLLVLVELTSTSANLMLDTLTALLSNALFLFFRTPQCASVSTQLDGTVHQLPHVVLCFLCKVELVHPVGNPSKMCSVSWLFESCVQLRPEYRLHCEQMHLSKISRMYAACQ